MPHAIIGRSAELAVLDAFLCDPSAEPRAVLIEGEPGIGKTTVFNELLAAARTRGYAVVAYRPMRSEMDLSYVGLVELLAGVEEEILQTLPAPQARVLRMMLRHQEPDGQFDRLSLCVAVAAAVRAVAAARPMLLAVDDAQWLDHPTAATLAFVVRRLGGTGARIAVVRRSGEAVHWREDLARGVDGRLDTLRLGALGPSELSRILRRMLGWAPAWPRLVRIAQLAGGNPLYAVELARAVGATRSGDDLDALPDGVAELARSRIARLPRPVRDAVGLASVLRNPTPALLDRIGIATDRRDALAVAERNGILTVDGGRICFTHPILAAAAYGSIPALRRQQLHQAAARLTDDAEERARHLAAATAEPDAEVARALADAAERAWRRGAPDSAADLLRLACQRTPRLDAASLAARRIAYGRLLHSAGDTPGTLVELETLVEGLPSGPLRARALFHLMYVTRLSGFLGRAIAYGQRAAAEAASDPSLQAEIYELLSRISDNDIDRKLTTARLGIEAIERVADPDPYVVFHVRAALVEAEFYAGLGIHLGRLDGLQPPTSRPFPPVRTAVRGEDLIGRLLAYAGRIDEGLDVLRGMYERASVESRSTLPTVLGWMAEAHIMAGRFAVAADLTREAIERAEEVGEGGGRPWEVGFHAVALAMLGRLDEAEAAATRVVSRASADPALDLDEGPAQLAMGIVALSRGQFGQAVTVLRRLDTAKRAAGIREPRLWAHAGELIEALLGAGDPEAAEALSRLEAEARRSGSDWSSAVAARCEALLRAADGRLDEAAAAAQRSLNLLEALPMPFERARTLFVTGQIHRRRKEKRLAREAFGAASEIFTDLGAAIWAARSRTELARIPQRQSAAGLTPTEQTVARLAIEGLSNREIADRAFLSPKTVEANLTRIYRKLGVRSRAALAGRLAADADNT